MPTAAKLFAAILLGALAYFAADRIAGHLPEEIRAGMLRPISAFFGILIGWKFLGCRVGGGYNSATGVGLSAVFVLVATGLIFFAGNEMIRRSLRKSYGGPVEGLQDMVQIAIDFLPFLGQIDVLAVLIVGGIVVGWICETVNRFAS